MNQIKIDQTLKKRLSQEHRGENQIDPPQNHEIDRPLRVDNDPRTSYERELDELDICILGY